MDILKVKVNGQWVGIPAIQGEAGQPGPDGFSPIAAVTKSGNITTITITDKNGTTTSQITDSPAVATIAETQAIITEYTG